MRLLTTTLALRKIIRQPTKGYLREWSTSQQNDSILFRPSAGIKVRPYFLALAPILAMRLFGSKWRGGGCGMAWWGHGVIEAGTPNVEVTEQKAG